eukprot:8561023-Alexandrium_andersonii.AAC.1
MGEGYMSTGPATLRVATNRSTKKKKGLARKANACKLPYGTKLKVATLNVESLMRSTMQRQ